MRTISIKMTLANRTISLKYFVTFLFILHFTNHKFSTRYATCVHISII